MKNKNEIIKIAPGVCCQEPSCTKRIKNVKCNNCNKSCEGCKWQ